MAGDTAPQEPNEYDNTSFINFLCKELGITPEEWARRDVTADPYWVGLHPWLEEQGYQLRPRFRAGWTPSWLAEGFEGDKWKCEDYQQEFRSAIMDGVRVRDGALVRFKRVNVRKEGCGEETQLAEYLSDPSLESDHHNHCVPVYDILKVPDKEDEVLIVTPLLCCFDEPAFETVGEVVLFLQQMIEGLCFLHSHNIAHGDVKSENMMADSGGLYNERPHPATSVQAYRKSYHAYKPILQQNSRTTKPINYFYTNFKCSKKYASRTGNLERNPWKQTSFHKIVPEFLVSKDVDPFPVDVWMLGMTIRDHFVEGWEKVYSAKANMEWMGALTRDMTMDDPVARPPMEEVMQKFAALTKELGPWKLRSPVYSSKDGTWPWTKARHWIVQISRMVMDVPAVPTPGHREIWK